MLPYVIALVALALVFGLVMALRKQPSTVSNQPSAISHQASASSDT
jgi:hypothetical protein